MIAFVGSVFSPYYAWKRRHGPADPLQHCALNIALYGESRAWAMTERGASHITRTCNDFTLGPSALHWNGEILTIHFNERTAPLGRKLRGTVRLRPLAFTHQTFTLDAAGQHRWSPLAPVAEIDVSLEFPALHWSGQAYLDSNEGDAPLENTFKNWHWSRARIGANTAILYDVTPLNGPATTFALLCNQAGEVSNFPTPPAADLPATRWRVPRATHAAPPGARVLHTLEDAPFYSRSVLATHLFGEPATAIHESLSLQRFRRPWVQAMLPFRMPRVG